MGFYLKIGSRQSELSFLYDILPMFPKMCEIKLIDNRVETSLSTHTLRPGGQGQRQPSPGPLSDIQHLESEYSNQQPMKAGWGYHPGHQPSHG